MKNIKYLLIIAGLLIAAQTASAVVIQSVSHNSGNAIELGGILDSGDYYSPARTSHVYKDNPAEPLMDLGRSLFGKAEFIRVSHNDRTNATYQMTVTLASNAVVYLFIDKRVPVATQMPWVAQMGFEDQNKIMTFDESNNGSFENPFEIYKGKLSAGVHILKQQNYGSINMYGVAAIAGDPVAHNPTPKDKQGLVTDPTSELFAGVLIDTNLSWSAPVDPTIDPNFAIEYRMYMDPNQTKVTTGAANCAHFLDFTTATQYNPPSDLAYTTPYYWRVDANIHLKGKPDPNIFTSLWSFKTVAEDKAPVALAGNSIRTWLAKAQSGTVALNGSVIYPEDDSETEWTAYKAAFPGTIPATEVTFADNSNPTTTVTISAVGEYILQLTATDTDYPPSVSQMKVIVYADACEAAKNTPGYVKNAYDYDGNCAVDMKDLATFAATWLISTSATADILYAATVGDPLQALVAEYWTNIPGGDPNNLLNSPNYPNDPNGANLVIGQFKQPDRGINTYGQRIRGYIVAPTTGDYIFYISSDDSSRLFLSTDTNPANAVQIAYVSGYTGVDEWAKYPTSQTSAAKTLNKDQYYYVEVIMKEDGGGDHVSVGWKKPGDTTIQVIPGTALRWSLP